MDGRRQRRKRVTGETPVSKTSFSHLSVEDEHADTEREGGTCPARPKSQARTGAGEKTCISPVQLTTSRIGATLPG